LVVSDPRPYPRRKDLGIVGRRIPYTRRLIGRPPQIDIRLSASWVRILNKTIGAHITVITNSSYPRRPVLSSHNDHSISTLTSINSRGGGIFEPLDRLDIVWIHGAD